MQYLLLRFAALSAGVMMLTSAYHRIHSPSVMARTADNFLASLSPEQRTLCVFPFDSEERFNWNFIPSEIVPKQKRFGLALREMTPPQKQLAMALLNAGLSQQGYIKAVTIMSLEDVLLAMEGLHPPFERDPEKYYFTIFGTPSENGVWSYRVEGHHVSQNFTVFNGRVVGVPSFFGANPAEVRQGPRKGLRALAAEEDLGQSMLQSLDPEQKKIAIVDQDAYSEILTAASRKAALAGQPNGLPASKMNQKQFELLRTLVEEYIRNMPDQLAEVREAQLRKADRNIYFAWAGGEKPGQGHYYRVQTNSFLIEFDNTQNNANHIHSVWRDFKGDFGLDLLKEHYLRGHL